MIKINNSKQLSKILEPFQKLKLDLTILVDRCLSMVIWDEDITKLLGCFQDSKIKGKDNGIFRSLEIVQTGVDKDNKTISKECIQMVRAKIGPVAAFKVVIVIKRLPKTRSGKIKMQNGKILGDPEGNPLVFA